MAKNRLYLFDVDGTITPSRGVINEDFRLFLANFASMHRIMFITGSDREKTLEQLGEYLLDHCAKRVYQCNANQVWERGRIIRENKFTLPEEAHAWLSRKITESDWDVFTGKHFDHRPGMVNFSILGRGANTEQRKFYSRYDYYTKEREDIVKDFNKFFPELQASVAGETGIDISMRGFNKSQALEDFSCEENEIHFFGDMTHEGGNDYEIAQKILDSECGYVYTVSNWRHTIEILYKHWSGYTSKIYSQYS